MQEKTPLEIKEMLASNPILKIVDVREQWEFDKCHIENSEHIPLMYSCFLQDFWSKMSPMNAHYQYDLG